MYPIKRYLFSELIDKINIFNEIYMLDYLNNKNDKKWKDYLNPVTHYLYNISYDELITDNPLSINSIPGLLEMYYNIFHYIIKDFESVTIFEVAKELVISINDIKVTFDKFLTLNNFRVEQISTKSFGVEKIKFNIYPLV